MFRFHRHLISVLALMLLATAPAWADSPAIHPLLQPLVDQPDSAIPSVLRSSMGGRQGRLKVAGQEALDLHLRTTADRETLEALGIEVRTLRGGRATATVLPSQLAALSRHPDIQSISLPRPLFSTLSDSTPDVGLEYLRSQAGGVFSGATGSGVIIGVIDSGIDVDHPNFMDAGGNTRILFALDQNTNVECTDADIDGGTCPIVDEATSLGHGTHVTGIAAGNGAALDENGVAYSHVGVAPEANIIFVKSNFMTTGIIDGLNYIFDKADQLGMPAVVNLSLGSQTGAHDGTDSLEEEIDALVTAQSGRAVVVSAGNAREDEIHAEIETIDNNWVVGPAFSIDPYTPTAGGGNDLVQIVGYYPPTDDLTVHLWSPNGHHVSHTLNTGAGSPCAQPATTPDGYIFICNNYQSQLDQSTSDREIIVLVMDQAPGNPSSPVQSPVDGTWQMVLEGETVIDDGLVDFWMFSRLGGSSSKSVFSTHVDDGKTLNIPGTSQEAITVGAHITRTCWQDYNGNPQSYIDNFDLGLLAPFSSAGPTRDGRTKPDLSAPGMGVVAPLAHEVRQPAINSGYGSLVVNDDYLLLQGTSQAAPHVTGAVALIFEQNPNLSGQEVKNILRANARTDSFTELYDQSPGGFFPLGTVNYSFGAGKLDLGPWGFNDPYETNDQPRNAYDIVSGQTLNGYVEHAQDVDLFYLGDIASGDTVEIDLTNLPEDYSLRLQRRFGLWNSCGAINLLTSATSDVSGSGNESITYTASFFNLPRYIRVASSVGLFDPSANYDLRAVITRPETNAYNDWTAYAQVLPDDFEEFKIAGSLSGTSDKDVYRFKVKGSGPISLQASSRQVEILNTNGTVVATGFGAATYTPGTTFPGSASTYYARVSTNPWLPVTGAYTLTITH